MPGWKIQLKYGEVHVRPKKDLIKHERSHNCVCIPTAESEEKGVWVYTHHSLDGREAHEDG